MFRIPVSSKTGIQQSWIRYKSSSSYIRSSFIEYFVQNHGHKHVKSSSVVPLSDNTVPFVNAGMNQFKGVFLGKVAPPHPRVVNSQKCIRVGGKHNDLDVVGTDGHHHTFFEMLGNWSFGDYYKKEACQMAWDLLLGPYRLKPENLVVTYFSGDIVMDLPEDRECRDIWKAIGVPESRLLGKGAVDNFWEMGASGPCGPCTEIHHVNPDGTLTEIWNLVFIQCNRDQDGTVKGLRNTHIDTGMGLERMSALLQGVPSNYDTDLFQPIIKAIEQNSKGASPYGRQYGPDAALDAAYRRLADHARMISVCLADGVFPVASLNLKQIMRKSFKISTDVFRNPRLLTTLYDQVSATLAKTYPELVSKEKNAKLIMEYEEDSYAKLRSSLAKKWRGLAKQYPEVEALSDVELAGFASGYKELKETMSKIEDSNTIPGELVFKLYDTYGFQEELIDRVAQLNNLDIDRKGFERHLIDHKSRHKAALKEQNANRSLKFDSCIKKLINEGETSTNDQHKYEYSVQDNKVTFKPVNSKIVAILNEDLEWIDYLDPCEDRPYYLVTKDTNFYCEEGGQIGDSGVIRVNKNVRLNVDSAFKIWDFVFHKGHFSLNKLSEFNFVNNGFDVTLEIDAEKRLKVMKNHTAIHLLNAAIRTMLPNSVVCQVGSKVTDKGLGLNLTVYGEKLSQQIVLQAQDLVRKSIASNAPVQTRIIDSHQLSAEGPVLTVPGESYPETGLRLVAAGGPLVSRELCCGTHVPSTGAIEDFCITLVKSASSHLPTIHAITGEAAKEARELFCRAEKVAQVIDICDPERKMAEITNIRSRLSELCGGGGAPYGEYAQCVALLERLQKQTAASDVALQSRLSELCGGGGAPYGEYAQCVALLERLQKQTAASDVALQRYTSTIGHYTYQEITNIRSRLSELCGGGGAPYGEYAQCVALLERLQKQTAASDVALQAVAEEEVREASTEAARSGRRVVVHFLRCSYLMHSTGNHLPGLRRALDVCPPGPALLLGCAGGVIVAESRVPQELVTSSFDASTWLSCVLPVFGTSLVPESDQTSAQMCATKVSLITCELQVQDAMLAAIKYAQAHCTAPPLTDYTDGQPSMNRRSA